MLLPRPIKGTAHLSMIPPILMALFQSLSVAFPDMCTNCLGLISWSSYCRRREGGRGRGREKERGRKTKTEGKTKGERERNERNKETKAAKERNENVSQNVFCYSNDNINVLIGITKKDLQVITNII